MWKGIEKYMQEKITFKRPVDLSVTIGDSDIILRKGFLHINEVIIDKLLRPIFKTSYTHAFACGEEAGKWLFDKRKFEVINNGRDIEKFKYNQDVRKKLRKEYNLENQIVLGHVGTFNYQKNHEYLIDVFSELIKNSEKKLDIDAKLDYYYMAQ